MDSNKIHYKCECTICGQIANVQPDTAHVSCKGIKLSLLKQFPANVQNITIPNRQGIWKIYQEPLIPKFLEDAI